MPAAEVLMPAAEVLVPAAVVLVHWAPNVIQLWSTQVVLLRHPIPADLCSLGSGDNA